MNIVFSCDDNYAPHLGVALASIVANHLKEKINFYILDDAITPANKAKILKIVKNHNLEFIYLPEAFLEVFKKPKHQYWSKAIFFRFFIAELIEKNKVIYLDVDLIVRSSLKELWQTKLEDNYIAAIKDYNFYVQQELSQRLDIKQPYINSGVLLINCVKWRKERVAKKLAELYLEKENILQYYDQDLLNIAFAEKIKYLPAKYNVTTLMYDKSILWYDDEKEFKEAVADPVIRHYTTSLKPWNLYLIPHCLEYFKYRNMTNFRMDISPAIIIYRNFFIYRPIKIASFLLRLFNKIMPFFAKKICKKITPHKIAKRINLF